MATAAEYSTFTGFPLLPFELRLLIWEEALSALSAPTTLWAASMKFVGSKPPSPPCRLGLSCKEAWQVVQICCVRFQSGPPTPRPVWSWADPNKTVIHLNYLAALARFEPETALKFKHVVVLARVSKMGEIIPICEELCNNCPALDTLTIDWRNWSALLPWPSARYARLSTYAGPELGTGADHRTLRSRLAAFFTSSPRVHILTRASWNREMGRLDTS